MRSEQSEMRNVPFWIDSAAIQKFPRLRRNVNVDVVVVGAGITGITAAYLLKEAGSTVALIERERVATTATGHTNAQHTHITGVQLEKMTTQFAAASRQATSDA